MIKKKDKNKGKVEQKSWQKDGSHWTP